MSSFVKTYDPGKTNASAALRSNTDHNLFFKPAPSPLLQTKSYQGKEMEGPSEGIDHTAATRFIGLRNYVDNLDSHGQALSNDMRSFYEPRFSYDFSNVKLHTDSVAAKSAQSINALAYTSGNKIVFNEKQYSPGTDTGKSLLAHELTHVVQQNQNGAPLALSANAQGDFVQRKLPPGKVTATELNDAERQEYKEEQEAFFREQGKVMKAEILKNAGFKDKTELTTPEDAVKLISFWGLSMSKIIAEMGSISSGLTTRVGSGATAQLLAKQEQDHISALSPKGQKAYAKAIQLVRDEPFWDKFFAQNEIHIFPDLKSSNRFSGYNQVANDPNDPKGLRKVIVVHISTVYLENDFPEASASTIVHELSHTVYDPIVLKRALASLQGTVVDLLLEHPDIVKLRKKAKATAKLKDEQKSRLSQIIFEATAYGETEIFVHLQQLTHQPDLIIKRGGVEEPVSGAELILTEISRYLERLKKIGLDEKMLNGVLDQLGRRVDLFYDQRIAAIPKGSKQRDAMMANKRFAQVLFEMARKGETF